MSTVAILGAGVIGANWAAFFALRGLQVRVADPAPHAAAAVATALERARPVMDALGQIAPQPTTPTVVADVAQAVQGADHIQDALPEDLDLKRRVYAQVEAAASPRALIASSSSGLLPSQLQEGLRHPERLLVAHPCNPPYLMPLVELVGGAQTAPWAMDEAEAFYRALGKQTVRLRREVPGHIVNRLMSALWREAVHLVAEGYASVADVDRVVTEGLGARWAVCGPHQIFHLSGGDQGMAGFLERLGPAVQGWWADLGSPQLDEATCRLLIEGMAQATEGRSFAELARARDEQVIAQLVTRQRTRESSPD